MKRLFALRSILAILLALQVAVLAPAATAMHASMDATPASDCSGDHAPATEDCPCCPPGISMTGSCAVFCLATTAIIAAMTSAPQPSGGPVNPEYGSSLTASQTYPPVNPPPIG